MRELLKVEKRVLPFSAERITQINWKLSSVLYATPCTFSFIVFCDFWDFEYFTCTYWDLDFKVATKGCETFFKKCSSKKTIFQSLFCPFFSAPHEDLKALIAQAHRSVYRRESVPVITDLIDNIMSIPSCLQDTNSKVTLVREWIKQNPKPEKIDLPEPVKDPENAEKLKWNDTPGQKNKVSDEMLESTQTLDQRCNSTELPDIAGVSLSQPVTPKR